MFFEVVTGVAKHRGFLYHVGLVLIKTRKYLFSITFSALKDLLFPWYKGNGYLFQGSYVKIKKKPGLIQTQK